MSNNFFSIYDPYFPSLLKLYNSPLFENLWLSPLNVCDYSLNNLLLFLPGHENQIYNLFDQNDDNTVTKSDIDAVFRKADANNNNHISNQEFHA